jgi:hypothetical protein
MQNKFDKRKQEISFYLLREENTTKWRESCFFLLWVNKMKRGRKCW